MGAGSSALQPGCRNLLSRHLGLRRQGLATALQSSWNLPHLSNDEEKHPIKQMENCDSDWALEKTVCAWWGCTCE